MRRIDASDMDRGFNVHVTTARSQGATMSLGPGESTGGPDNRHAESDQWLYVVSGDGTATVEGREVVVLASGTWLLIEAGETHEIQAGPDAPLETISVYAPPAY